MKKPLRIIYQERFRRNNWHADEATCHRLAEIVKTEKRKKGGKK
jgi:hypothetical protein